ncbi:MAG: trypsin-like peptidase domain-containing protein, partial [Cellulomonadaceae bacterium]|nr:trypsin-like peptidase domain-containing protein [Cellulomonadaceae bacterium]
MQPQPQPGVDGPDGADQQPSREDKKPSAVGAGILAGVLAGVLAGGGAAAAVTHFTGGPAGSLVTIGNPAGTPTPQSTPPVQGGSATATDWEAVISTVGKSVVSIQMQSAQGAAEGSGFIIDDQGHIITNDHVVNGAQEDRVLVTVEDGRLFEAAIVGTDSTTDLAVVQIANPPSDLQPVQFGDSSAVQVGDPVLAIGNPLGLSNTATTGIVSALDRPVRASGETAAEDVFTNAIQVDAAINPGNSGGPLFNASGQVIGVNSSIATMSNGSGAEQAGSIGLGFAIPGNLVKNIGSQLIDNGSAQHAALGVTIRSGTATADGVTRRGAVVQSVSDGSAAASAGLREGDVVVAFNNIQVTGSEALTALVRAQQVGSQVTLTVVRNGQASNIDLTLGKRDVNAGSQEPGQGHGQVPSPTPSL